MSLIFLMLAIATGPAWSAETPYQSVWARKRAALMAQQAKVETAPAAKAKKPAKVKKPVAKPKLNKPK